MFKQAKRGSLVECFRLNSINLGVLKLEDLKVGKIYMLFESRNAWHSTWITQYSAERIGRVEHSQIVSVSAMVEGSTRPSD